MKKRMLALALCLLLLTALLPISAMAAEDTIETVTVWDLDAPIAGAHPDYSAQVGENIALSMTAFMDDTGVNGIRWTQIGGDTLHVGSPDAVFAAGEIYQVELHLVPYDGYHFADKLSVIVAGSVVPVEDQRRIGDELVLLYAFPACPAAPAYEELQLFIEEPVDSAFPSRLVGVEQVGVRQSMTPLQNHIDGVCWIDTATGASLGEKDAFQAGHSYVVLVQLECVNGVSLTDPLKVTLNGAEAEVTGNWKESATVQFRFPPAPGKTPNSNGGGSGYSFDCKGLSACPQFTLFYNDALPYDHWAHAAIDWAVQAGVTNGISEGSFGPWASCTRGQVVTFLWRSFGEPEPKTTVNPFVDVTEDWYRKAVLWAVENGITVGTDATHFNPNQTCSSAHILTFLYRAMGVGDDGWYDGARDWASAAGLLEDTGLTVSPEESCPRASVVTFLFRIHTM